MDSDFRILTLEAMGDNFIHLLIRGGVAAVVDPGVAQPVLDALADRDLRLELILVTHLHQDHIGGCSELQSATGCRIAGPSSDGPTDGEVVDFAGSGLRALATPGHTDKDLCYHLTEENVLFSGDTLFLCGCGRVFGGDYLRMWRSLQRISSLPKETLIYCGHDYTAENIEFALGVEPGNRRLQSRSGSGTIFHSQLEEELATNPFLRADSEEIRRNLGMAAASDGEVFARLRQMKDVF